MTYTIDAMRKAWMLWLAGMMVAVATFGQGKHTVYGYVEDAASGERLPGATIHERDSRQGVAANGYGFFVLVLPEGRHVLRANHVGYALTEMEIELTSDTMLTVKLVPGCLLDSVDVRGTRPRAAGPSLGSYSLSPGQVRGMASVLGEADVFKALQFLPGVNGGQEGMAGFSVRGGSPDQTQFLLDGLPVYNVNHAFGYFSAFNGEALQDVELHAGSLPARYGGHLAGVVEMRMREGNRKRFAGSAHLSPVAGSVVVEGPLKRDRASFLVSARRTWLDGVLRLGFLFADTDYAVGYNFYDLNAKVNWEAGERDQLFLSFYNGRDSHFGEWENAYNKKPDRTSFRWGNVSVAARWNHVFSSRLFSNVTLYYSRFNNNQRMTMFNTEADERDEVRVNSHLEDATLKADFDWRLTDRHYLRFGGWVSRLHFLPEMSYLGSLQFKSRVRDSTAGAVSVVSLYAEDTWRVTRRLSVNAGLRLDAQFTEGKTYVCLQPRLSAAYMAGRGAMLKAAWARTQQPVHLLVNTSVGMNADLWVPATERVAPSRGDLWTAGVSRAWESGWEVSAEGYYRSMSRVARYRDGVRFVKDKDDSWQEHVDVGDGRAWGVDVMARKSAGRLTGWVAYSLSKSERRFAEVNGGSWFPFEYDRRHKANAVANYRFPERQGDRFLKGLTVTFTYASGNWISLGKQLYAPAPFPETGGLNPAFDGLEYIDRPNNVRMPACHHLDVAYTLDKRKWRGSSWVFAVYNVYARRNPSVIYHRQVGGMTVTRAWSLLPFVPSVTWVYTF